MKGRVLVIDDEDDFRLSMVQALDLAGFEVEDHADAQAALSLLNYGFKGIVVTDIRMPNLDGLTLMDRVAEIDPEIPVILVTGHGDVQLAVRAMRQGAHDFLEKPFRTGQLTEIASRAMDFRRLLLENRVLRAAAGQVDDLEHRLVGRTNGMIDLRRRMRTIGPTEADVLIVGETGVGKEVVARALHDLSPRATRPFIAIDCAALPTTLIESELFGHDAGAFAGAMRERYGKLEHAQGGTILLDEIGSLPIEVQGKFLRAVEQRVITRLGSHEERPLDVRFIATSRHSLENEVAAGRFRADLLYRLNVVTLNVPPLSERRDDIPLLFSKLLQEAAGRYRCAAPAMSQRQIADINARPWPGNVRELRNAADRVALGVALQPGIDDGDQPMRLADQVAGFERNVIASALLAHDGRLKPVYESLGLSRKSLYEKMQKYGIDKTQYGSSADDIED
ncbi:sigma-54 dependent transcriptional regulator [Paracoccus sp. TK19116]|uniref:Sigma-54 dependent transcriptional regulator n=1 Tax=Paracoccus albicereus TaxID=2922394 RepID=A0ABT1MQ47_9RHOB|nr:sigma-54 dependent transcriptional regulator [Paracoccus albicereus]MCQ0970438.1 sigma-54 dependent transcriptional regulator [Paracoccus albicereus]